MKEKKKPTIRFFFFFRVWTYHLRIQSKTMKIPKYSKIHNKSTKPIQIWTDWYPKNNPNPSKFRNPKFGKIKNHKTNLEVGCGGVRGGVELWWGEEEMDLGFMRLVLLAWENIVYSCLRIVGLIELWLCVLECNDFPLKLWRGFYSLVAWNKTFRPAPDWKLNLKKRGIIPCRN